MPVFGDCMKEKWKVYRPAVTAFLVMMAMSLTSSTMSFFLEPVCGELQVGRGSFSAVFSLMTLSGAATTPFLGRYAGQKGTRQILLVSGIWMLGAAALFSGAKTLGLVYLAAFLMGMFGTNCVQLCASVIVQQSYEGAGASGILGLVMAGSGAGGMIFNLLIPAVMAGFGWRQGMLALGVCWAVLLWTASAILGHEKAASGASGDISPGRGMTRREALRSPRFYLLVVVVIIITACCGFQQQQPSVLAAYGFGTGTVSLLISGQTAVLALGKILQGLLYGKLGIRRGGMAMLVAFSLGLLAMLSGALVYPGLILLALGFGTYTTLMPLVTRNLFGTREYGAIWGMIATVGSVGTFAANPLWGTVYDLTGSYRPGLLAAAALLVIAVAVLSRLMKEA